MEQAMDHTKQLQEQGGFAPAAATAAASHRPSEPFRAQRRCDGYAFVHKGLRAFLCEALTAVGRMDPEDSDEIAERLAMVRALMDACRSHLKHENEHVHAAMEARRPGSSARTAQDHVEHEAALGRLEADVCAVERSSGQERIAAAGRLYRHLALFVAENLEHMHVEETQNNYVLWESYTDEELIAVENAIKASIPPRQMAAFLRWMVPFMNAGERALMLSGMKQSAPAEVFGSVMAAVKPHLTDADWRKLMAALEPTR
jgi:hypothetical protein